LNFDERIAWQGETAALAAATQRSQAKLGKAVANVADDDPDALVTLMALADEAVAEEQARFPREVDHTIALVADDNDGKLREALMTGHLHLFQELRDWLKARVIDRTPEAVEDVAGVPPTLLPPPSDSPNITSGGPVSDGGASSSTG
jgi:hypothetical protein